MLSCTCCCTDAQEELRIHPSVPQEYEAAPAATPWALKQDAGVLPRAAAAAIQPLTDGGSHGAGDPYPPLGNATNLESVVSEFVGKALKGLPCTLMDDRTGARRQGRLRLDRSLKHMTIRNQDATMAERKCVLARIQDVFAGGEDEDDCFAPAVLKALVPGESTKLIRLCYLGDDNEETNVNFLMESQADRSSLMEGLRVLCESK
mmetsp:Transcript_10003/g.22407  ORF Transcript_10003/g.22407 Transcript_10003/m.22407 type:complete len:205 (+) Transcript_10003:108-722(+)